MSLAEFISKLYLFVGKAWNMQTLLYIHKIKLHIIYKYVHNKYICFFFAFTYITYILQKLFIHIFQKHQSKKLTQWIENKCWVYLTNVFYLKITLCRCLFLLLVDVTFKYLLKYINEQKNSCAFNKFKKAQGHAYKQNVRNLLYLIMPTKFIKLIIYIWICIYINAYRVSLYSRSLRLRERYINFNSTCSKNIFNCRGCSHMF